MAEGLTLPSPAHFEATCKRHDLSEEQIGELKRVLWWTHLKFDSSPHPAIDGEERRLILRQLTKFQKALHELLSVLGEVPESREKLSSEYSNDQSSESGRKVLSKLLVAVAGREKLKSDAVREALSFLNYGLHVFGDELLQMKESVDLLVDVTVKDRGGKPADLVRNYLAVALCESSQKILGRPAASTAGGRFVMLVRDIFADCGLTDTGVEELVERTVTAFKKSR